MERVNVALGKRSYAILIESGLLHSVGKLIASLPVQKKVVVISNTTIAPLYLDTLKAALAEESFSIHEVILPDGEKFKTLEQTDKIYNRLIGYNLDRNCALIALGGGVVGDITGFAAATFMRGVPFIQIPTTLLAQVDSSVGGKTGVNLTGAKNMVGAFYQPMIVIIDPKVLLTLNEREMNAGIAEVIKYSVIKSRPLFEYLEQNMIHINKRQMQELCHIIKTCCDIKADITSCDETEQGIRSILNFGHTIGHAVETLTSYNTYKHGEAVAVGMSAISKISWAMNYCSESDYRAVELLIKSAGLSTELPVFSADEYINVIMKDKKRTGDKINMVLLRSVGEVVLKRVEAQQLRNVMVHALELH